MSAILCMLCKRKFFSLVSIISDIKKRSKTKIKTTLETAVFLIVVFGTVALVLCLIKSIKSKHVKEKNELGDPHCLLKQDKEFNSKLYDSFEMH